jgi:hypothetical protein
MAEPDFESQLTRMFAEPPSFPDAALFNAEVEARLDRGWAMRRVFIALGGTVGGPVRRVPDPDHPLLQRGLADCPATAAMASRTRSMRA